MPDSTSLKERFEQFLSLSSRNPKKNTIFLVKLMIWIMIFRVTTIMLIIIFPDSKGLSSFLNTQIAPIADISPTNDSYFYWYIAKHGFDEWKLINFSPLFPIILSFSSLFLGNLAPFLMNSTFLLATVPFMQKFLAKILKNERDVNTTLILLIFNPIFFCYSVYGLTEPLHYFLLFVILNSHYSKGVKNRIIEYSGLILITLNRFISVILAVFYFYKAIFQKKNSIKRLIVQAIPGLIPFITYLAYEIICKVLFGHTPSEAREVFWNHEFNFNPFTPEFVLQLPLLLSGAILGILVLKSRFNKDRSCVEIEEQQFSRIDMQALIAFAAVTLLFLGLFNKQISILRYLGTLFPFGVLLVIKTPTSKFLPLVSFVIFLGMIASHVISFPIIDSTVDYLSFTMLETSLVMILGVLYLISSVYFYSKRDFFNENLNRLLLIHFVFIVLVFPITMYFP
ncbi:MAG: hypothetical protein ACTSVI_15500 [Promethearchaeota archaeon]